jgi:hypothetical protein
MVFLPCLADKNPRKPDCRIIYYIYMINTHLEKKGIKYELYVQGRGEENQPFLLVFLCQEAGVFVFFLLLGVEESSMDLG